MSEKRYDLINNTLGWVTFLIAAFVYLSTIEPTVSLWDCGEFISASYKMEVVHPPGAPFFLLVNRLFTMFAPGSEWVPVIVNAQSALFSALTIMILFWTITALGRKILITKMKDTRPGYFWAIMGSGIVGAMAFTFSDTFWFSAVEGEVYALSTLIMALVFWLMLKWDQKAERPGNLRWFIMIAFLVGVAIGVHLLSLVVIPVIAYFYYFRRYDKITVKGAVITGLVGFGILGFILQIVIKSLPFVFSRIELIFVNNLGLPYFSGVIFAFVLLFGLLAYGIYYSVRRQKVVLNVALISLTMIIMGFSSYSMVVIRSLANPPIDMNNPENIFNLISYINREQYGDRPLLYGPYFTADVMNYEKGRMDYRVGNNKYVPVGRKRIPEYDPAHMTIFPRMGDRRADRKRAYRKWTGISKGQKPTFADNLEIFFEYQLGHMYWRYFAWNFIGRQNNEQGHGGIMNGNWLSGINFLDEAVAGVGPQDNVPPNQRSNKARNTLFFLPFILGLLGMYFHFNRNNKDALLVLFFFLMTGIMLVVYLNNPPREPRERDYTLVGSFYAFAIWIGIGTLQLFDKLKKNMDLRLSAIVSTLACLLIVPGIMAKEEWDDHDRSERFTTRDFAKNYLISCDSNAVLFTNGDNDTYPVWYLQEVEGFRTDVRVINMQLLTASWYGKQLRHKKNNSPPLPLSIPHKKLVKGKRDYVIYQKDPRLNLGKKHVNINEFLRFIASDRPGTTVPTRDGKRLNYYPTKRIRIPVNKKNALESGIVPEYIKDQMVDEIKFNIRKSTLLRSDILLLDLIATSNWTRPVHFSVTAGRNVYLNLDNYLLQAGLTLKLTPIHHKGDNGDPGKVDPKNMYDNMVNKFKWGGLDKREVYIGGVTRRHCRNYRHLFSRLAKVLIRKAELEKAVKTLDRCVEVLPERNVPYDLSMVPIMELYYSAQEPEKGKKLAKRLKEVFSQNLEYYAQLSPRERKSVNRNIQTAFYALNKISRNAGNNGQEKLAKEANQVIQQYQGQFFGS